MKVSAAVSEAWLSDLRTRLAGGWLRLYDGVQPAGPGTAPGAGNDLLAEAHLASPAFDVPTGNSMGAFEAVASDVFAAASVPTWGRFFEDDGTTAVADASIGPAGEFQLSVGQLSIGNDLEIAGLNLSITQTS